MTSIYGFICTFILCIGFASAQTVDVVAGLDKPPYIIVKDDTGFEVEVIKAALAPAGYKVNMLYVPMGRSIRFIKAQSVDAALSLDNQANLPESWLSDVYVVYQNVVISLADRNVIINSIEDLNNYTLVGFQTASNVLGERYAEAVRTHSGYLEMADHHRQVKMLLLGSVDSIVMDYNIFQMLKIQLDPDNLTTVNIHQLFPANPYHVVIPDRLLRETFNRELKNMIDNGDYEKLIHRFELVDLLELYNRPVSASLN
ncbi:transporter substrate-binding domain-containing protein [Alteromonas sp. C1M14]|uniref:substrate-binding periplasmic protein n=1 Tax=Alteromonas sp. C1M14 TaxID=2841567 RepID=UPI001C0A088F|nr:transporter substrate-binding domain-containing protein [Alteromonas sp. C1M14]MBU2978297.1 transporter substrate-binding domain-containing protein [Alteromonas sp. C1M14]